MNDSITQPRNVVVSTTNAICALAYTIEASANMLNGLADAGRIRSESFARVTEKRVQLQEKEADFDLEAQAIMLEKKMDALKATKVKAVPKKTSAKKS